MTAKTIYQLLRTWAEKTPEAIALVAPGRTITYQGLLNQISAMIKVLRACGIAERDRVAILLPSNFEMAFSFLGVSCVATSAPINPLSHNNELELYLSNLPAKALLVSAGMDSAALSVAERLGIPIIELVANSKSNWFSLEAPSFGAGLQNREVLPDDGALILHTSGTTSIPKRVPLTHGNLAVSAFSVRDALDLVSRDRCLGVMPLFHIHGLVGGLLSSLAAGGSYVAVNFDPERFLDWMTELEPTWYTAVPTIHQAVLSLARARGKNLEGGRLRLIRSSSASLSPKVMAQLEEVFKVPVIEAYGMTEASHQIASNRLPPLHRKSGSVGVAINTEVAIVDETGNFLPPGERGEIIVRGPSVTAGYEPVEANEQALVNGWLHTGDMGYLDSDGYLFITGRIKDVINRGGEKIFPAEIDQALLEHEEVLEAAAFAIPQASLGEDLVAAVVVRNQTAIKEAKLLGYLAGRLPSFKLPSRVILVNELPKGSTGKVLRSELAGIFAERLQSSFVAPRNDLERIVAGIYQDVLEIERVGIDDNFFGLGGDSLRATQALSRIRSLFSINLSIATFFFKATVAQLAAEITEAIEALKSNSHIAIPAESIAPLATPDRATPPCSGGAVSKP
jgi:oxalate---CoA ligase